MVKYLRHGILVSSLLFLSLAFALPAKSEPDKAEIDNYARANGFPRSDYPYYEPVNSCGGEGATSAVPDKYEFSTNVPAPTFRNLVRTRRLVVFRADFNDACNKHDRCYMTVGEPRENCDARFLTDLLAACDSGAIEQKLFDLISGATATCASLAGTYAGTVAVAGELFYPNAQDQARRYATLVNNFIASSSSERWVRIQNRNWGRCLNLQSATSNGVDVNSWECVSHPDQEWRITDVGDGYVRIQNRNWGHCLNLQSATSNGVGVNSWECVSHPDQEWRISPI